MAHFAPGQQRPDRRQRAAGRRQAREPWYWPAPTATTAAPTLATGGLNVNNPYALGTGPLTISGGTLGSNAGTDVTVAANNAENWNGDFTFAGSNNLNLGAGAVSLGGSRSVTVSSNTLTVGGPISGSGFSLTKAGSGTLVLGGSNSYSGGTIINAGNLIFTSTAAIPTGTQNITIASGGASGRCRGLHHG